MLMLLALGVGVYVCRRPLFWILTRMFAFAAGFIVGWRVMNRP